MIKKIILLIGIVYSLGFLQVKAQNNALHLNGSSQYVTANGVSNALAATTTLSMEAWVFPTVATGQRFILNFHANNFDNLILFGTNGGNLQLSQGGAVASGSALPLNQWSHIALTIDASNNATVYLNGKVDFTAIIANRPTADGKFTIGQDWDGATPTDYFGGQIDEVRVWNTVRTQADINANMFKELAGSESGLVAYYNMNFDNENSLTDNSSNSNEGLFVNSPKLKTSGAFAGPRNALDFDGTNDYVSIPTSLNLNIIGDITLEAWVKMDALPGTYGTYCRFICKGSTDNNEANNILYALNITSTGRLEFAYEYGAGQYIYLPTAGSIPVGVWQHIAVVRKQSSKEVTFYVDGKQFGVVKTYTIDPTGGTTGKLTIGAFEGVSAANPFSGEMDEVRIWNKTRTAGEIREDMMKTLAGTEAGLVAYYRFDQIDGTTLYDIAGNDNNGTLTNMTGAEWTDSEAFDTWLGIESSTWSVASNWSDGIPTDADNVGIYKTNLGNEATIAGSPTLNNLLISSSPTLSSALTVNGNLIPNSNVDLNGQNIVLGNLAFLVEGNGIFYGSSGTIKTTRSLSNISENVAGLGAEITTTANMGSTTITRGHNSYAFGTDNSIKRYFDITPSNNSTLNATLSFLYSESELNGNNESGLELFKSTDNKSSWQNQNGTANMTSSTVSLSGISAFSSYTLIEDTQSPSASITYSPSGLYHTGDNIIITATFTEDIKDSPVPQIAISGSNTVASSNMSKTSSTIYTYSYTVQAGPGNCTISLSVGTDLAGNVVESTPTNGAIFTIENQNPTITSTPVTSVNDNETYTYSITAADADGDNLILTVPVKPEWLTFTQTEIKSIFAGSGSQGTLDGAGIEASFNNPTALDVDNSGNVYVADYGSGKIRKITPDGLVTTLPGSYSSPNGVAVDGSGNIYVSEWGNRIKKITPGGVVSTFAGSGVAGYADGIGTAAQFTNPSDVEVDAMGNVYVSEHHGNRIRKITPEGSVSTLAGSTAGTTGSADGIGTSATFYNPTGLAIDASGNIFVADFSNSKIRKITSGGVVSTFASGLTSPRKLDFNASGDLFVSLQNSGVIKKITPAVNVSTFASGFSTPQGVAFDNSGNMFVAAYSSHQVFKIQVENKLTGSAVGQVGDHSVSLKAADTNGGEILQNFTITVNDVTPPSGYSVAIDQDLINAANKGAVNFTLASAETGTSCNYTFASNNGGTPVSGSTSVTSASQTVSDIDLSGLEDGHITLSVTLTDAADNEGSPATDSKTKDATLPTVLTKDITAQLNADGSVSIIPANVDNGSNDIYGIASLVLSQADFNCNHVGTNVVTLTITDNSGNINTATATVTVSDTISPEAVCENITVYLDSNGNVSLDSLAIDNGSSDNCSLASHSLNISSFNCNNVGANDVIMTVTDVNSNFSTCQATVTVSDTISPEAVCKNITVYLDSEGNVSLDSLAIDNGSSDNCSLASHSLDISSFNCNNVGAIDVIMTVTDVNSNFSTCQATVTVSDTISPEVVCENITVYLDSNGNVSLDSLAIDNGSSDNCSLASHSLNISSFNCNNVGANDVIMTVTDVNTNSSTCQAIVTVSDTISPSFASCSNLNKTIVCLGEIGNEIAAAEWDSLSIEALGLCVIENCSIDTIKSDFSWDNYIYDCCSTGSITVVFTAVDASGNSSTFSSVFTIIDTIPPTFTVPNDTVIYVDENCDYDSDVVYTGDVTDENDICCETLEATYSYDVVAGDCPGSWIITRTWSLIDGCGNTAEDQVQIISVEDTIPPTIVVTPMDVILYAKGEHTLNDQEIAEIVAGTTDNCTSYEDLSIMVSPKAFECVHVGEPVNIKVTVTDLCGNVSVKWTTVTIYDETPPVALCKDLDLVLGASGKARINPSKVNDDSYDACGISILNIDQYNFDCSDIGENTVTLTVVDAHGNTSTCESTVTVFDNTIPVIEPVADVELVIEPGKCESEVEYPTILVTDNCETTLELTEGLGPDGVFPVGTTTETWLATDDAGNTATVSFDITIVSTNALPTIDEITDISIEEDTNSVEVTLTGISAEADCEEQDVTVSATSDNAELITSVTVDYTTGDFTGTITMMIVPEMSGEAGIIVTVEDEMGEIITDTFMVSVTAVNDAPFVVHAIADQVINASYVLKVPVSQTLGDIFDDIDDETLTFGVSAEGVEVLPGWVTIMGDTLVCTPTIVDTGCVNIIITAMDAGGLYASDTFAVCVNGFPTAIIEIGKGMFEVQMYPNPTRDIVNMDISSGIYDVELSVTDITGKVVLQKKYSASENITFDMSGKVSGMYFVKMNVDGNLIVKKLIVDRK